MIMIRMGGGGEKNGNWDRGMVPLSRKLSRLIYDGEKTVSHADIIRICLLYAHKNRPIAHRRPHFPRM